MTATATRRRRAAVAPTDLSSRSLVVPALDAVPWPSLGGQVCSFIESLLVHGPGDVLGQPAVLTPEYRLFLWRAYEIYPRGHVQEGRRRFKRVALSRKKGAAKTEIMSWVAICELDPDGPVRFGGWDADGNPVGIGVRDPYIPLVATTEEQSDELAFGAAREILLNCDLGNGYDIGLDRITPRDAPGKMVSVATAPNARDGARTTFQGFDETHGFVSERLKNGHGTMQRNLLKRKAADAWGLETTTMYEPGAGSVAEATHDYALDVARGAIQDPRLYFDHRQASLHWDLSSRSQMREALEEAAGDSLAWTDVPALVSSYFDPTTNRNEWRRFWLNQRVKGAGRWLNPEAYERLAAPRRRPKPNTDVRVVLGFDGSNNRDSTALVGCTVAARPHVWIETLWERPRSGHEEWRVPRKQVESAIEQAFSRYEVVELAPDPPGWYKEIEEWEEMWGELVVRFETNQPSRMGPAADQFFQAVKDSDLTIDGSEPMLRHLGNCHVEVRRGWKVPVKASADSPDKIDVAIAGVVAHHRALWHVAHPPVTRRWQVA